MDNTPFFELAGTNAAADPFGLWAPVQTPRPPAPGMESFETGDSIPSAPPPEGVTWRVNLPDAQTANTAFAGGHLRLVSAQTALDSFPERLDEFIQGASGQKTVSFETGYSPETDLLSLINGANAKENISFDTDNPISAALEQARGQFEALLALVNQEVLHFAWVETRIGGQFIARTSIDWSGDAATTWQKSTRPEQASAHQQALKMAVETRNLRLRMLTLVAGGAARISAALLTPGGAVMALPLVYQYVTAILAQASPTPVE